MSKKSFNLLFAIFKALCFETLIEVSVYFLGFCFSLPIWIIFDYFNYLCIAFKSFTIISLFGFYSYFRRSSPYFMEYALTISFHMTGFKYCMFCVSPCPFFPMSRQLTIVCPLKTTNHLKQITLRNQVFFANQKFNQVRMLPFLLRNIWDALRDLLPSVQTWKAPMEEWYF